MHQWLVGVDAGGTNTRAAACSAETGEIRLGRADGANWTVHGPELCRERIERAVAEALPPRAEPAALCLCIAGYYPPDHEDAVMGWAASLPAAGPVRVETDVTGAWAGAFGGEPGVVLISGTGSICYGRNSRGREARAGGWGPLFGDQGSAYWVGLRCLGSLSEEVDGIRTESPLGPALMTRWPELGGDLRTWLRGIYRCRWGREEIAGLAAEAVRLWEDDQASVGGMMLSAVTELVLMAMAVETRLQEHGLPLALQGGLALSAPLFTTWTTRLLKQMESTLEVSETCFSPLEGALLLAAEACGGAEEQRRVRDLLTARAGG